MLTAFLHGRSDCLETKNVQDGFLKSGNDIRYLIVNAILLIDDVAMNGRFNAAEAEIEVGFVQDRFEEILSWQDPLLARYGR